MSAYAFFVGNDRKSDLPSLLSVFISDALYLKGVQVVFNFSIRIIKIQINKKRILHYEIHFKRDAIIILRIINTLPNSQWISPKQNKESSNRRTL